MEENRKHRDGCNDAEKEMEYTEAIRELRGGKKRDGSSASSMRKSEENATLFLVFTNSINVKNSKI